MKHKQPLLLFLFGFLLLSACVTRTERFRYTPSTPYQSSQDNGVWAELRHELGWDTPSHHESFYTRTVRGVKETVSGWFGGENSQVNTDQEDLEQSRRQFEQQREAAFRRLRARQQQEQGLSNED
jgi:hypothetical protein